VFKLALVIVAAGLLSGCITAPQNRDYRSDWSRYDYDRPDPAYGNYYADGFVSGAPGLVLEFTHDTSP